MGQKAKQETKQSVGIPDGIGHQIQKRLSLIFVPEG
jgi:hypothetical protein